MNRFGQWWISRAESAGLIEAHLFLKPAGVPLWISRAESAGLIEARTGFWWTIWTGRDFPRRKRGPH